MIPEVEAVVKELDEHRARFEAFCRSLSPEEAMTPVPNSTWVVKDFISHLATIDGPVGEMFASVHAGADPSMRDSDGGRFRVDDWNDRQVEKRRGLAIEEILREAAESRAVLHGQMDSLTAADVARVMTFGGDSKRPASQIVLLNYLRGWNKHDPMHVIDMLRGIPQRMTPELEAWFDDPVIRGYQAAMNPGNS